MKRPAKLSKAIIFISALFMAAPSETQAQLTKITVSYAGESPTHLPAWIAADAGIFHKNGLNVQLIRAHSDVSVMALLSGEIAFAQTGATSVINSRLELSARFGGDHAEICPGQSRDRREVCKSQIEAVHLVKTDRETGTRILTKYLKQLREREALEQSYTATAFTGKSLAAALMTEVAGVPVIDPAGKQGVHDDVRSHNDHQNTEFPISKKSPSAGRIQWERH
jgi:hypothetical protein